MEKFKKVAIITGASSGIGLETAKYFSQKNYIVYGISKSEFSSEIFTHYQCNICDIDNMKKIFDEIYLKEGRIDLVINNAGLGISGAIESATKEDIATIFNVNLIALVNVCRISIAYLRKTKGRIINTGSVAGVIPLPFQACYSATKSAVENFSQALDMEVKNFGIRVCCVRPGDTKTKFTQNRIKNSNEDKSQYKLRVEKSVAKMEKDEQKGMSPICVSKLMYKLATKKNPPYVATVGFSYKFLCALSKILPNRLKNYIIKKIYG